MKQYLYIKVEESKTLATEECDYFGVRVKSTADIGAHALLRYLDRNPAGLNLGDYAVGSSLQAVTRSLLMGADKATEAGEEIHVVKVAGAAPLAPGKVADIFRDALSAAYQVTENNILTARGSFRLFNSSSPVSVLSPISSRSSSASEGNLSPAKRTGSGSSPLSPRK